MPTRKIKRNGMNGTHGDSMSWTAGLGPWGLVRRRTLALGRDQPDNEPDPVLPLSVHGFVRAAPPQAVMILADLAQQLAHGPGR